MTSAAAAAGEEEESFPPTPHAARHSADVEHAVAALLSTSEKAFTAPGSGEDSKARASPRAGTAGIEEAADTEAEARRRKQKRKKQNGVSFLAGDGKGNERRALLQLLPPSRGGDDDDDFVSSGIF